MNSTASNALRRAGFAAMCSGILYVVIQGIHPADVLSSVTTAQWAIVHYLGLAMSFLGLLGIGGVLFARRRAVWCRDVPRPRPATLGGRSACGRDPVAHPRVVAGPAPVR